MTNDSKLQILRDTIEALRSIEARDISGTTIIGAIDLRGWSADDIGAAKIDRAIAQNVESLEALSDIASCTLSYQKSGPKREAAARVRRIATDAIEAAISHA